MIVGVCRIHLFLAENDSLKGKRAVVKRLLDRVRARFNTAAAEVGSLDAHEYAELACVVVSNESRHAQSMLTTIAQFCEREATAEVVSIHFELVPMGKPVGDLMVPRGPELEVTLPEHWKRG